MCVLIYLISDDVSFEAEEEKEEAMPGTLAAAQNVGSR